MRNALIYLLLLLCMAPLSAQEGRIPVKGAFLQQLQERDSVLVADQLLYGFELDNVLEGTRLMLPEFPAKQDDRLMWLSPWQMDTIKITKQGKDQPRLMDLKGSVVISSFEEGLYELPHIIVGRMTPDGNIDTLIFDPMRLEVKTMPVDTSTFIPHDIKGQIRYPVTFRELLPWIGLTLLASLLIALVVWLVIKRRRSQDPAFMRKDPAHIVALRKLDQYRGSKLWAPEKQKIFYSGVTDTLREYIDERYGIGAMEMTTAEIFNELKSTDAPKELLQEVKGLFERADFVKFAKFVASDDDNATALPLAVRFVTETYQADIQSDDASPAMSEEAGTSKEGGE